MAALYYLEARSEPIGPSHIRIGECPACKLVLPLSCHNYKGNLVCDAMTKRKRPKRGVVRYVSCPSCRVMSDAPAEWGEIVPLIAHFEPEGIEVK